VNVKLQKVPVHNDDEIKGYIHRSEAILAEAGYDDDERIALLPTILNLIAAHSIISETTQPLQVPLPAGLGRIGRA